MKKLILCLACFIQLISFAEEDLKIIQKKYSFVDCYYIPGMNKFDEYSTSNGSSPDFYNGIGGKLKERLENLTISFPAKSVLEIDWKNKKILIDNTAENHAKLNYIIQSDRIFVQDFHIKTVLEFVEIKNNRELLKLSPTKLSRKNILSTNGAKIINKFSTLGANHDTAKSQSLCSSLSVKSQLSPNKTLGQFDINWQYKRIGNKPKFISLKTTFIAANNESRVTQVQQGNGQDEPALYLICTFIFMDKGGAAPALVKPVKINKSQHNVRMYHGLGNSEILKKGVKNILKKAGLKFPTKSQTVWRPKLQTLILVNTEENLLIADKIMHSMIKPEQRINLSVQLVEMPKNSIKKKRSQIVSYKDIIALPAKQLKYLEAFHCSSALGADSSGIIKFSNRSHIKKDKDNPEPGLFIKISTQPYEDLISLDVKWIYNTKSATELKEQALETRITLQDVKTAVFQLQGSDLTKTDQFLIIRPELVEN